jgi:hypothetical protein
LVHAFAAQRAECSERYNDKAQKGEANHQGREDPCARFANGSKRKPKSEETPRKIRRAS